MNSKRKFRDFNKEIIFGEAGAIVGASIIAAIASLFTDKRTVIAQFAVLGSMCGGSSLFVLKKISNKKRRGEPVKSVLKDLEYYTPMALLIAIFIGYPILYNMTKYFIKIGVDSFFSGAFAEFCAFLAFAILINLYRFVLVKRFKRDIE